MPDPVTVEPWYTDRQNFWCARSIFHPNCAALDIPFDRGGFKSGTRSPERLVFVQSTIHSVEFKRWLKSQTSDSCGVYKIDNGTLHFRATNNHSYGYTYLWAWEDDVNKGEPNA